MSFLLLLMFRALVALIVVASRVSYLLLRYAPPHGFSFGLSLRSYQFAVSTPFGVHASVQPRSPPPGEFNYSEASRRLHVAQAQGSAKRDQWQRIAWSSKNFIAVVGLDAASGLITGLKALERNTVRFLSRPAVNGELPAFTLLRASLQIVADRLAGTQSGTRLERHLSPQAVNFIYIPFLTRPNVNIPNPQSEYLKACSKMIFPAAA
jgi:hypothetical protein